VRADRFDQSEARHGSLRELPVLAETIPDFELVTWHGVMVPAATPREVLLRLNREIQAVLESPTSACDSPTALTSRRTPNNSKRS